MSVFIQFFLICLAILLLIRAFDNQHTDTPRWVTGRHSAEPTSTGCGFLLTVLAGAVVLLLIIHQLTGGSFMTNGY
ncbi:MAG TPA: hypothetical protein PKA05_00700 [Roseiflexaceae bacterium]|nr:hypothetical protein [Roseiflexaceae bacterium]HMP38875.1 hypothetical protein [Roseiflexaceae bacterium]